MSMLQRAWWSLCAMVVLVGVPTLQAATPLVEDGAAVATIYATVDLESPELNVRGVRALDEAASLAYHRNLALRQALEDLNYHLERMSGAALPIVSTEDPAQVQAPAIVVGELGVTLGATPTTESYLQQGFRLLNSEGLVLIGGESDFGAVYGVYELLEELGCTWIMPGAVGEVIPERATVSVPDLDRAEAPAFEYRSLWYRGGSRLNTAEDYAQFALWKTRHKMTLPGMPRHYLASGAGHYWDRFIKTHKEEFEADPTMYALVRDWRSGEMVRRGPQLESTHPRVVELMAQGIIETFEKNDWPKDKRISFPIGPADGGGYSQSVETQNASAGRMDPRTGKPDTTDLIILLGNQILERLGDEYPNVHLGFYLYSTHADFPARYTPHPRIAPIIAPINYSRLHSLDDRNSKSRTYFRGVMEQWIRLHEAQGNPMFFRGYNWNLAENMVPFTRLKMWGVDIPWYERAGVTGMNVEATKAWGVNGPHDYLYAKMIWDTDHDWRQVIADYCRHAFGPGAEHLQAYYEEIVERQHGSGAEAGSYHSIPIVFDQEFVQRSLSRFAAAEAAAGTEQQQQLIHYHRVPLEQLGMYLTFFEQMNAFRFSEAAATVDALMAHWEAAYEANSSIVAKEVPQYIKRFLGAYLEQSVEYSTDPYEIVYKIPDALPTLHDPYVKGHMLGFHHPGIRDHELDTTRTFSTTWDNQGLAGIRDGAIWYRVHVELSEAQVAEPIGLFLGGVEDEARVWCNGELIGAGRGFSIPYLFDLTDALQAGNNVIAIQVVRNRATNEIFVGGILRPSFLFTGPRLERKAPRDVELRRVLPGGSLGEGYE